MAGNPEFFVEVLRAVYIPENSDTSEVPEDERQQQELRARNGYSLLSSWRHPPGLHADHLDAEELNSWFAAVSEILTENDRVGAALAHIGQALAHAPVDADGLWPGEVVREFVEERASAKLESGLMTAILNERGAVWRGLEDGGVQEEELAKRYQTQAEAFADEWPRTSALMREIARSYTVDGRREDQSAERFRAGLE
jgi:hypothetical protein